MSQNVIRRNALISMLNVENGAWRVESARSETTKPNWSECIPYMKGFIFKFLAPLFTQRIKEESSKFNGCARVGCYEIVLCPVHFCCAHLAFFGSESALTLLAIDTCITIDIDSLNLDSLSIQSRDLWENSIQVVERSPGRLCLKIEISQ